jgi:hypothetical protein
MRSRGTMRSRSRGRLRRSRGLAVPARDPAAVGQPELASGREVAACPGVVRVAFGLVGAQAAVRLIPVRRSAVIPRSLAGRVGDQGRAEVVDEMTGRPHGRVSWLAPPRLVHRTFTGVPQQLPVVPACRRGWLARQGGFLLLVVFGEHRRIALLGRGRRIRIDGTAARVPGQAVCVTAEAGVATFHQIPPGPCVSSRAAGQLPLSHECRSVENPRKTMMANYH